MISQAAYIQAFSSLEEKWRKGVCGGGGGGAVMRRHSGLRVKQPKQ